MQAKTTNAKLYISQGQRWQPPMSNGIDQTVYVDAQTKYHKTACTSLPEDEHLNVRNMSKTL